MAFDTFDTDSVATAGVTFTNGNLTAQGASGTSLTASSVAQTLEGKKSGKWYVEFTCVAVSGNVDGVGVLNSWGLYGQGGTSGFIGGIGTGVAPNGDIGWGYFTNATITNKNTGQTAVNHPTWTTADVIGMAIDLDNGRIWWRKNTGSWAGTSGTPDPATNTSGFDISHLTSNNCRVYPAANISGSSGKFTANFGASAFTGTVPSGFTSGWTNTTSGTYFGTFATMGKGANGVNAPPLNNKAVSKYTATLTGNVLSVIVPFAGSTISDIKGVVYDATGTGGLPGALLGVSTNTITSGSYGENALSFSGVSVTSGSDYWFGVVSDSTPSSTQNILLCPPQTSGIAFNSGTYASPTNPFGASPSTTNFRFPIIVNIAADATVNLSGVNGTAAAGALAITADRSVTLAGMAASASAGALGLSFGQSIALTGVSGTAAAGIFSPTVAGDKILSGVSGSAQAGSFTISLSAALLLDGVQATGQVGVLPPVWQFLNVPLITIMNDNPIPVSGDMVDDVVPVEADMPFLVALETVINTNPIPMTGTLSPGPLPGEGSVP